jgi:hypothetical protein
LSESFVVRVFRIVEVPIVKLSSVDAERVVRALLRPGYVSVEGDRHVARDKGHAWTTSSLESTHTALIRRPSARLGASAEQRAPSVQPADIDASTMSPVADMPESITFYETAGFDVEPYDAGLSFVHPNDQTFTSLDLIDGLRRDQAVTGGSSTGPAGRQ